MQHGATFQPAIPGTWEKFILRYTTLHIYVATCLSLNAANVDFDPVDHAGAELCEGGEHGGELRVAHVVLRHHYAERRPPTQTPSRGRI